MTVGCCILPVMQGPGSTEALLLTCTGHMSDHVGLSRHIPCYPLPLLWLRTCRMGTPGE